MRKLFFLFVTLVATTSLWAFQSGDLYYRITSSSAPYTVEVTSHLSSYPYNEGVDIITATIPETVTYNGTTYSVTSIGREAFYGCTALTIVICKAILVPSTGEDVFAHVPISSAVLYVPDESVDIYKYMSPWDRFGTILPISQLPNDVEDVQISSDKDASVKKVIRNGQVVILHNDKSYNIMGQEVE